MDELLQGLIAGDADEDDEAAGLGALSGILGSLGGGAIDQSGGMPSQAAAPSGGGMGLLGALLGGGGAQSQTPAPSAGGMGLLGALMGGGVAQSQTPAPSAGGMGLLGALTGGGGLGGLLGGLLGGGAQTQQAAPSLPAGGAQGGIANALAEKLGVSPAVAAMIVSFAMALLLQALQKRAAEREGVSQQAEETATVGLAEAPDLSDLLKGLGGRGQLGPEQLKAFGATTQFAEQAGIDVDVASQGVAEAFRMLGDQFGGQQFDAAGTAAGPSDVQ